MVALREMDSEKGKYLENYLVERRGILSWKKIGEADSLDGAQEAIKEYFNDKIYVFPSIENRRISNGKIIYNIKWKQVNLLTRKDYSTEVTGEHMHNTKMRITPRFYRK